MIEKFENLKEFCDLIGAPTLITSLPDLKIVYCNSQIEDLLGQLQIDIINRSLIDYFNEKSQQRILANGDLVSTPDGSPVLKGTYLQLIRKSGRQLPVSVTTSLYRTPTQSYAIFSIEDLSEFQKVQQEKELLTEEVFHVSKLADIGRLAAGLAHELNNPLAIIQGFAEDLDESLAHEQPTLAEVRKNLAPILGNAIRMNKIILKMMGLVRGDRPQLEKVLVKDVIGAVEDHFTEIFKAHGVKCSVDVASDLSVLIDPTRIEQIIINILNNAVHAVEKVEDRRIEISASADENSITIRIWNNGPEISATAQASIFTPFFTTKNVGDGLGLGLYLSYNIIKAHGGDIWFESSAKKGTAFFIKFAKETLKLHPNSSEKPKIIVVDDESFLRQILCKKLSRLGLNPVPFKNSKLAIEAIEENESFQGLLTDLRMPQIDGWQLIETLKKIKPNLPVGIITSFVSIENEKRAKDLGVLGIIGKPISDGELEKLVSSILKATAIQAVQMN